MVILHVSTIIFLVIIRYNVNTFQVVNYIGHNTDLYCLTNYCAVLFSFLPPDSHPEHSS
jgi:hypothetical protein